MSVGPRSQCAACARYRSPWSIDDVDERPSGPFCEAFPVADGGIPDPVYGNEVDHRRPVEGDHGVRWTSRNGLAYPQSAFDAVQAAIASGAPRR